MSSIRFQVGDGAPCHEEQDLTWSRPLLYSWSELDQNPDRCAYRWIRLVRPRAGFRLSFTLSAGSVLPGRSKPWQLPSVLESEVARARWFLTRARLAGHETAFPPIRVSSRNTR